MRIVLACLAAGLLAAILGSSASGGAAHKGLSARTAQVGTTPARGESAPKVKSTPTPQPPTAAVPLARSQSVVVNSEPSVVRSEQVRAEYSRSRTDNPQFLIYQRAQRRAQERINRIEARQRLGISLLRPRPLHSWYYEPVLPWFVHPRFVYFAPF
jgi:hypothetical protein